MPFHFGELVLHWKVELIHVVVSLTVCAFIFMACIVFDETIRLEHVVLQKEIFKRRRVSDMQREYGQNILHPKMTQLNRLNSSQM